jgi:hypothetical protein
MFAQARELMAQRRLADPEPRRRLRHVSRLQQRVERYDQIGIHARELHGANIAARGAKSRRSEAGLYPAREEFESGVNVRVSRLASPDKKTEARWR